MTFRFPNLVNASDWLCCVGNFLPPIRSTIQIWVVWNFYACSSEVISRWNHWWYRGMAAVFLGIVAGHVEEKRSIWIRYCNLNVLVFFFFFFFTFCLFVKNWRWRFWRNNGYRITTEIHAFKWCIQTGKSWFVKFGCFFFFHSTYRKPREDAVANYVIWLKSKTCIFMACVASLAFRASCS